MAERRYTLDEARQEFNRQECAFSGHDYEHMLSASGELMKIVCDRCGRAWSVQPDD